jgi:hypothetical protein
VPTWSNTVLLHVDRQEAHPVGGRRVAVGAQQRLAVAAPGAEPPRHLRDAVGPAQVHLVRELEPVPLPRALGERYPHRLRLRTLGGQHRLELGVRLAEVAGVAERSVRQPRVERAVAVGAEALAGRLHPPGAIMLGVTVGAGTRAGFVERVGDLPLHRIAPAHRPAGDRLARRRGVVRNIRVAGQAGLVAHRDERFGVTRLALVLEPVVGRA